MSVRTTAQTWTPAGDRRRAALDLAEGSPIISEVRFRVMGTDAHVAVATVNPASAAIDRGATELECSALLNMATARLIRLEEMWSRFLPDSELSTVNANPGRWVDVSAETVALVDRALMARDATLGLFDPMLLGEVVAAGYGRSRAGDGRPGPGPLPLDSLGHLGHAPSGGDRTQLDTARLDKQELDGTEADQARLDQARLDTVPLDRVGHRMRVAPGFGFDPGGIAKGFAADMIVGELLAGGADAACVNIGGDLRVGGEFPGGWTIAVEDPMRPGGAPLARLSVAQGGVATSSRCRRRWTRPDGSVAHHLIDPSTGRPAQTEVLAVTVVAAQGWTAEAVATAVFLAGPDGAAAVAESAGATGLLVTTGGVISLPGIDEFLVA